MKIIHLDIETAPNVGYHWGLFNQNISLSQLVATKFILTFVAQEHGKKKQIKDSVAFHTDISKLKQEWLIEGRDDFDVPLLKHLAEILDGADVICGHNVDRFDLNLIYGRRLQHGIKPPKQPLVVDTYKIARNKFNLVSNKLDHLLTVLKLDNKISHSGMSMWVKCIDGDKKAWADMLRYNAGDVSQLPMVYDLLRPWAGDKMPSHRLFNQPERHNTRMLPEDRECTQCLIKGSAVNGWGFLPMKTRVYNRYKCTICGEWMRGDKATNSKLQTIDEILISTRGSK